MKIGGKVCIQLNALKPKFYNFTLACEDSLTLLTYEVILVAMSTVSGGLLRKPHYPYPLVYVRGGAGAAPSLRTRRDRG